VQVLKLIALNVLLKIFTQLMDARINKMLCAVAQQGGAVGPGRHLLEGCTLLIKIKF